MTEKEITMNEQLLMCPFCGEDNMHHGSVIVFTRGLRISAPACETDDRSPGGDRDGFIVRYQCEECGDMEQHTRQCDGCTYIQWRMI